MQWPIIPIKNLTLGRIKWILDIIWPLNQHFNLKNQRNWIKQVLMLKFLMGIICILLRRPKKLTLVQYTIYKSVNDVLSPYLSCLFGSLTTKDQQDIYKSRLGSLFQRNMSRQITQPCICKISVRPEFYFSGWNQKYSSFFHLTFSHLAVTWLILSLVW